MMKRETRETTSQKKRTVNGKRRYAIHEAGHALAAVELGIKFKYATLETNEDLWSAEDRPCWRGLRVRGLSPLGNGTDSKTEREAMMMIAGYVAELVTFGKCEPGEQWNDRTHAENLLAHKAIDAEEMKALLRLLEVRVEIFLRKQNRQSLMDLAEALLERTRLRHAEVSEIRDASMVTR